jgi:MFS family permease
VDISSLAAGGSDDRAVDLEERGTMALATPQLNVLVASQLLAGVGVASGIAVGALLAERLSGTVALAGLAQTASVLGAGVWAIPLARLAERRGRRWGLSVGYALAVVGTLLIIVSAVVGSVVLLFVGLGAFGAATAAGLQARFAATEVTTTEYRARAMSIVLWATTIGSIGGPNLSKAGSDLGAALGLEPLAGPYLFALVALAAAALIIAVGLRPPKTSGVGEWPVTGSAGPAAALPRLGLLTAIRVAVRNPLTRLGMVAVICSHTVMVGVMVMTPVHMHDSGFSLALVGLVLSIHIFGMYGASPVMGWLADRISPVGVLVVAVIVFAGALSVGAMADGHSMLSISLALGLLGLGWSAGMIGGSTLLTTSVAPEAKVSIQGATDSLMNLAAACSAATSGLVVGWGGYPALNVVAACVLLPLVVLTLRRVLLARRAGTDARATA